MLCADRVLAYIHPIAAGLTLLWLAYAGSLGIRARNDRRHARDLLRRHRRTAPPMYWCMVLMWIGGLVSAWLLRPDLQVGTSPHLRIGAALVGALTGGAITSRYMRHPQIRALHPWFGAAAMLLAAAQIFFGLQIT